MTYKTNVILTDEDRQLIAHLRDKDGATMRDVIRRALHLLRDVTAQQDTGGKVVLVDAEGKGRTVRFL